MEELDMELFAIRRRSAWADTSELEKTAAKSARIGDEEMANQVRWIRSYVVAESDGRLGTICISEAKDMASLRDHARRVGMPGEDIEAIVKTVVVRTDPQDASASASRSYRNARLR
ncbi:nickel-binding protein [Aquibium sp. LZ166]|uniref:Nickel-binding protein n=1 Tax=Aquibium pacificus TaxID=3153579 RepID=A0ABV3SJ45_9HYPH